jgi:hypothetical protein
MQRLHDIDCGKAGVPPHGEPHRTGNVSGRRPRLAAAGAFDTGKYHDAIAARGATASGIVLGPMAADASPRNAILRTSKRVGWTILRRWIGHHRRSRAEARRNRVKRLGQRLCARAFNRQVAEFPVPAAILNSFSALAMPVTETVR